MKKLIIVTVFVTLFLVSCESHQEKVQKGSDEVIQAIYEENLSRIESLLGVMFEKNEQSLDEIFNHNLNIITYEMLSSELSNEIWKFAYIIHTESTSYTLTIEWQRQPKKWLISSLSLKDFDDITAFMSDELIEQVENVCSYLTESNYSKLYQIIADDFGEPAGYLIDSEKGLVSYIENEFSFIQPKFNSFEIMYWSKIVESGDDEVLVVVNKDQPGEFRLGVVMNADLKLSGIYCIEFEHAKKGIIGQLPNNIESYLSESERESISNEKYQMASHYTAYVMEYLMNHDYPKLYQILNESIREKISLEAFTRYITLMRKRSFTEDIDVYLGAMIDMEIDYDEATFMMSGNGYTKGTYRHMILDKENAVIRHGFNAYIEVNRDVVAGDNPESIESDLSGIVLHSASLYEINPEYFNTLTEEEQMNYYIPVLNGSSVIQSPKENKSIRMEKAFELIEALKYEDFDKLWAIESYHTGFDSVEELKEYYELQVKLVGSFNSIFMPIKGYDYLMTGQFIIEFAFVDQNEQLSKLLIAFDSDNQILSYDVMNVKRGHDEVMD